VLSVFILSTFISADPVGPTGVTSVWNETMNTTAAGFFNISGGYIAALNLSVSAQNMRWKAFVGWVTGGFTLDDSSGSTIYDWSTTITNGRVYATRDSSTIEWNSIECANLLTNLESENTALNHTQADNITATFSLDTLHDGFLVAGEPILPDTCPTLNTFVNDTSQDDVFDEVALYDGTSIVYAALLSIGEVGYDGNTYDFQMLVPENGTPGFSGATAYYLYAEIEN
jgi:hypothetical protein